MPSDTGAQFPVTRLSIVHSASSEDSTLRERAFAELAGLYWAPVYTHLRIQWRLSSDDAADATQEFMVRALTRELFAKYDERRARFRTYVRICLDSFMANELKASNRTKRSGSHVHIPLDEAEALTRPYLVEGTGDGKSVDVFDREWLRSLIARSLQAFERHCAATGKEVQYAMMVLHDIDSADSETKPSYSELAQRFDVPVTQVTNYLAWARRQLRERVLETLRSHSGSEEEFRDDARHYFGVNIP